MIIIIVILTISKQITITRIIIIIIIIIITMIITTARLSPQPPLRRVPILGRRSASEGSSGILRPSRTTYTYIYIYIYIYTLRLLLLSLLSFFRRAGAEPGQPAGMRGIFYGYNMYYLNVCVRFNVLFECMYY